ncbi:unnamed protein product [Bursaphelenchus okinawaensis]|uniref:Uncharacterized protein n=1 Tax=Bursaphelenchus okinawaensis TaxID=465554 RepID=A0A811KBI5_9BILA|nr:unnamed protein product [Bursaphelenchus okinawaensis]CAG9096773.1 unnamed protein product [Bursaphelenchus okinawaensis]
MLKAAAIAKEKRFYRYGEQILQRRNCRYIFIMNIILLLVVLIVNKATVSFKEAFEIALEGVKNEEELYQYRHIQENAVELRCPYGMFTEFNIDECMNNCQGSMVRERKILRPPSTFGLNYVYTQCPPLVDIMPCHIEFCNISHFEEPVEECKGSQLTNTFGDGQSKMVINKEKMGPIALNIEFITICPACKVVNCFGAKKQACYLEQEELSPGYPAHRHCEPILLDTNCSHTPNHNFTRTREALAYYKEVNNKILY